MDGFTGFKTATTEELPDAVAVMDPFHVVRLAGDALDRCRRRVQQSLHGHRGRTGDPLYRARRTLHTGADLLTDKQQQRLNALFAADAHVEVEATWGDLPADDRRLPRPRPRQRPRALMTKLIESLSHGVPAALTEVITLGRTLKQASRRRPGLLRPARHQQRPDRGDQRPPRTPPRLRPRLPQPHQLHRPIPARDRRIQTPTTPSIVKSRFTREHTHSHICRPHRPDRQHHQPHPPPKAPQATVVGTAGGRGLASQTARIRGCGHEAHARDTRARGNPR